MQATDEDISSDVVLLSLRCIRIGICCRLADLGHKEYISGDFSDDIYAVIGHVKHLEGESTDAAVAEHDAYDIISAVCGEYDRYLKEYIDVDFEYYSEEHIIGLHSLFCMIADYFELIGRSDLVFDLFDYICFVSLDRCTFDVHCQLVINIFKRTDGNYPERILNICKNEKHIFLRADKKELGNFLWFYAKALKENGCISEAKEHFFECYAIRKNIFGEDHWEAAKAKREFYLTSMLLDPEDMGSFYSLRKFIDEMEAGKYKDEIDEDNLEMEEGLLLGQVLQCWLEYGNPDDPEEYLDIFERLCLKHNDSRVVALNMRNAKHLRGLYYLNKGDYLQADDSFSDALRAVVNDDAKRMLSDVQINIRLLSAYVYENDKNAQSLTEDLINKLKCGTRFSRKEKYSLYAARANMIERRSVDVGDDLKAELKAILLDACEDAANDYDSIQGYSNELMNVILSTTEYMLRHMYFDSDEMRQYFDILYHIQADGNIMMDNSQNAVLFLLLDILSFNLKIDYGCDFANKSVEFAKKENVHNITRAEIFQTAAMHYAIIGKRESSMKFIEDAVSELNKVWRPYVQYLNDSRLLRAIDHIQRIFSTCYELLRNLGLTDEYVYEKLIQFKALASLAGRERNKVIFGRVENEELVGKIREIQDKIACLEPENIFCHTTEDYSKDEIILRDLEALFAENFPDNVEFTDISWDKVCSVIPDESTVVEFFFYGNDFANRQMRMYYDNTNELGLDVFITQKSGGVCTLNKIRIHDGSRIIRLAGKFTGTIQDMSNDKATVDQRLDLERIRSELLALLIRPVLPYISESETVYIAPDRELMNIPFALLFRNIGRTESFNLQNDVIIIECIRDFLFGRNERRDALSALIIGDAEFDVEKELYSSEKEPQNNLRYSGLDPEKIYDLPFSGAEAGLVKNRFENSDCYTGIGVTKDLIFSAEKYNVIHIATHGYFDFADKDDVIYSSCILLSGVKNWLRTGEMSKIFGNGIVTADEFSRMDLRNAELVVLSSCFGGMNDVTESRGFHGMVSALSAAGVKYVISSLWAVDDFSSAILMDRFYYEYMDNKLSPPKALQKAKNYIRQANIPTLRKDGYISLLYEYDPEDGYAQTIIEYEKLGICDRIRPLQNELHWGGFVCYECN